MNEIHDKKCFRINGLFMMLLNSTLLFYALKNPSIIERFLFFNVFFFFTMLGIMKIPTNTKVVVSLFGKYIGTIKKPGLHWAIPFTKKIFISNKIKALRTEEIHMHDSEGHPIIVKLIITWNVNDCASAIFNIEHYEDFFKHQSESQVRHFFSTYPLEATIGDVELARHSDLICRHMMEKLQESINIAGIMLHNISILKLEYHNEIREVMINKQKTKALYKIKRNLISQSIGIIKETLDKLEISEGNPMRLKMTNNLLLHLISTIEPIHTINLNDL